MNLEYKWTGTFNASNPCADNAPVNNAPASRLTAPEDVQMQYIQTVLALTERITQLEHFVMYPNGSSKGLDIDQNRQIAAKKQAARQQATENLYAPLRSDTRAVIDLAAFARRLIDMQDLGHAVTEEVRVLAKRALGVA